MSRADGERLDVRDELDRLEGVKDFIVGFLEGAATPDPATRALWQDDAKGAFYDVVAAADLLASSPEGNKEDRRASTLSFLEMAKGRVGQVSSELRTYKTDVAEDLIRRLQEAFEGASQAISVKAGVVPAPVQAAPIKNPIVKLGDEDYVLNCSECGQEAAFFRTEVPKLSTTGERMVFYEGVTKSTHFNISNEKVIFGRLEEGNLRALHDYVEHLIEGGVDAYCPLCDRVYCEEHYDPEDEWDEGFYDCTYGTCPRGHRRILDD